MNGQDRKDLNVILERMDQADKDRDKIHQDIKFIKENLFNPHEGLWAETKQNSQFRENTTKWRGVIGVGFIGLIIDIVWSVFNYRKSLTLSFFLCIFIYEKKGKNDDLSKM